MHAQALLLCLWGFRKRAPSQTESTTWWEKTREEDHIAEMSQLGPSSRVIIDTGRHMGYGKHPPTRRRFPTSDNNLPVSIVPGSAVGQDHAQAETGEDFDAAGQNGDSLSPGQLDETATGSTASAAGNDSSDPGVLHNASAKSNPVVVVTDGGVKFYDIPPLTVKELEWNLWKQTKKKQQNPYVQTMYYYFMHYFT